MLSKVADLCQGTGNDSKAEVARCLLMRKHEFKVKYIDA